jgi:hypothetical protein
MKNSLTQLVSVVALVFLFLQAYAQPSADLPGNSLQFHLGVSQHGTDNVAGASFSAEYSHYFRRKVSVTGFVGTTIHDGKSLVNYWNSDGEIDETEVNFTTAGLQSGITLGYDLLSGHRHCLQGSLGILIRYQTTSNPDIIGLATTFPYPEYEFPARSVSLGGVTALTYTYTFGNGCFFGVRGWLQYDSNDDAISAFSLLVGKSL